MSREASSGLRYDAAVRTHQGKVKDHNEDHGALRQLDGGLALALADGMTRLAGGEEASRLAAEALLASLPQDILKQSEETQLEALLLGFKAAQKAIDARVAEDMGLTGMGTTLVGALLGPEMVTYQYSGDSRLYWLREGAVLRITRDHSVVQALVELGRVKPDEAEKHPMAGKLTSHLGGANTWGSFQISPDPSENAAIVPNPGDVILLCSDGVPVELGDLVLAELACCSGSAEERAELILDAFLETEARDNATVALAVVVDHDRKR